MVGSDDSNTQRAETFLDYTVLIIPVMEDKNVLSLIPD